ncbi:putative hva22-like protein g [Quercus suber]|uniref:Hva22-like protein g n=1 Tax=Quercus suber TaxID=58331 RepID=A0AAW0JM40_QUESU
MMGSFLSRALLLVFGYAYPAYECFKTVEKNKSEIEQLLFWCQYWEIDHTLLELRVKAWDIAIMYWQKAVSFGQTRFFEILQYVSSQSASLPKSNKVSIDKEK